MKAILVKLFTWLLLVVVSSNGFSAFSKAGNSLLHSVMRDLQVKGQSQQSKRDLKEFEVNSSNATEPWEVNKGLNTSFFQGDIVLTPSLQKLINSTSDRKRRAIKKDPNSRWANGVVHYELGKGLSRKARQGIQKAIKHWRRHTCIRFHKRKPEDKVKDYIQFVAEDGCWSSVGRQGGLQKIGVGEGCEYFGTIMHEIGHAMGMWHEQSRSDRNTYVKVVWDNIDTKFNDQFSTMAPSTMDSMGYAYDYESIMHYGSRFFTNNNKRTLRIRKLGREAGVRRIGQRKKLSYIDIAQISAMYHCNKVAKRGSAVCAGTKKNKGRGYRGNLSYTEQGITCQPWDKQWPHKHKLKTDNYYKDYMNGLLKLHEKTSTYEYHNHCRNPNGKRDRPWCFTTLMTPEWQYCDLKLCL